MAQVINTNIASLNSQRNLNNSQSSLQTSLQRLSTGLRINSAKDDAAGLAIAERFTTQIRGLNQAGRNANDAISLTQTAEGALGEVTNNLQRIRELAVQSANATNSASDRAALQAEVTQRIAEISRIGSQTQFNGLNLLDGSFKNADFQVGANANQLVTVAQLQDARASALGGHTITADGTVTGNTVVSATAASAGNGIGAAVAGDAFTITTTAGTTSAITYAANSTAAEVASAINSAASGIGVTATASNSTTLTGLSAGTISFTLFGGQTSGSNAAAISAAVTDPNDLSNLVSAINGVQGSTGISAEFSTAGSKASITLKTTDGRNIGIDTFANSTAGNQTATFGGQTLTEGAAATANAVVTGTVSLSSSKGAMSTANAKTDVFNAVINNSSFQSIAALDISSAANAQKALATLDVALGQVSSSRADLGAYQNRFESTISNLQTTAENLSASRSRIQDTDFASETANLTRSQILQQAGTAMLAQANALPQQVLTLLRG